MALSAEDMRLQGAPAHLWRLAAGKVVSGPIEQMHLASTPRWNTGSAPSKGWQLRTGSPGRHSRQHEMHFGVS